MGEFSALFVVLTAELIRDGVYFSPDDYEFSLITWCSRWDAAEGVPALGRTVQLPR